MINMPALIAKNGVLCERAKVLPERVAEGDSVTRGLTAPDARARYQMIAATTYIPW
jgi:hypothetical protein